MTLYRYEYNSRSKKLHLRRYNVERLTAKGRWIIIPKTNKDKWVPNEGECRFAHPSQVEALHGLIKRMERHMRYMHSGYYQYRRDKETYHAAQEKLTDIEERIRHVHMYRFRRNDS